MNTCENPTCGNTFTTPPCAPWKRYCSKSCQQTAQHRRHRSPVNLFLPVEPLIEFITRGDRELADWFPQEKKDMPDAPMMGAHHSKETGGGRKAVQAPYRNAFKATQQSILRAVKRGGRMPLHTADKICCQILGVHPYVVYGDLYFNPETSIGNGAGEEEAAA